MNTIFNLFVSRLARPWPAVVGNFVTLFSVLLSMLTLMVLFLNLYFTHLRVKSELSASVSELSVTGSGLQDEQTAVSEDQAVLLTAALTNSGNAPSSLLKVFWLVPREMKYDCLKVKDLEWDLYSSSGFTANGIQGTAFSMNAAVVSPANIVIVKGVIASRRVYRNKDQFGTKTLCLVFVSINHLGSVVIKAFPTYQADIRGLSFGSPRNALLTKPLNLLD